MSSLLIDIEVIFSMQSLIGAGQGYHYAPTYLPSDKNSLNLFKIKLSLYITQLYLKHYQYCVTAYRGINLIVNECDLLN